MVRFVDDCKLCNFEEADFVTGGNFPDKVGSIAIHLYVSRCRQARWAVCVYIPICIYIHIHVCVCVCVCV
jgi:hypothetical protein